MNPGSEITLTWGQLGAICVAIFSAGGLVMLVRQTKQALDRAFQRIEKHEQILIANGMMEVDGATQSGEDGRGVPRPRGLPE